MKPAPIAEEQRLHQPTMAVVIPVYNGRNHLAETLQSVLDQSFQPCEIFVVEDGSPQHSADIVARFPSVRYIVQQNGGVSSARNHGAAIATAEWICFLDQDDVLLPGHLEQFHQALQAGALADLFYTPRLVLTETNGAWTTSPSAVTPPAAAELPHTLRRRCPFPPSGTCVRRSTFQQAGGFDSRYDLAEDWEFWWRICTSGHHVHRCPQATVCYRVHPQSNSHRPIPILKANLRVIRERILPQMTPWERFWAGRRLISVQEGDAGILMRHVGFYGGTRLLLRSLLRFPFGNWRRYKIAAYMTSVAIRHRLHLQQRKD